MMRCGLLIFALAACARSSGPAVTAHPRAPIVIAGDPLTSTTVVPAPRLRHSDRPLPADIAQYRSPSSIAISPAGDQVLYLLRVNELVPDAKPPAELSADALGGWTRERQLWSVPAAGGEARQLTRGSDPVSRPRWAPDGSAIGFVREHHGKPSIHILPMAGGEARVIDHGELVLHDYAFSADGTGVLIRATGPRTAAEKEQRWRAGGAYRYDRSWRPAALYRLDWDGEPVELAIGEHVSRFSEAPDGKHIAVVTAESSDPYHAFSQQRLRIVDRDGKTVAQPMATPAATGQVTWSPDSRHLAFERGDKTLSLLNYLAVVDVGDGKIANAAAKLDPTLAGFAWSPTSGELVVHLVERTRSKLVRVSRDGTRARTIATLALSIDGLSASADGGVLAARSSGSEVPHAPSLVDPRSGKVTRLVDPNPEVGASWKLGKTEIFRWKNGEGVELEGVLTRSPRAPATAGPLLVLPHGGPDGVSVESFNLWSQFFAARGYSVFRPNYRGGLGYGYAFYAANRGRLGDVEFADIESGVDALIAGGAADPARLYYGGWSWGWLHHHVDAGQDPALSRRRRRHRDSVRHQRHQPRCCRGVGIRRSPVAGAGNVRTLESGAPARRHRDADPHHPRPVR